MKLSRVTDGVFFNGKRILNINAGCKFAAFEPTPKQKCDWSFFKFDVLGASFYGVVSNKGKLFIRKCLATKPGAESRLSGFGFPRWKM